MKTVVMYSKNNCPACVKAAALLDYYGIPYSVVKIDEDADAKQFLLSENHRSVPQFYVEGKLFAPGGLSWIEKLNQQELYDKLK